MHNRFFLQKGYSEFKLSNLLQGVSFVSIVTQDKSYSAKLINTGPASGAVQLDLMNTSQAQSGERNSPQYTSQLVHEEVTMDYQTGDLIKLVAYSEGNSCVHVFSPTQNDVITLPFYACTDYNGNDYPIVTIGNQQWMAMNLRTTHYKDGAAIPLLEDEEAWMSVGGVEGGYCWYQNNVTDTIQYGALYNGFAVLSGKLAPAGWHVATLEDYEVLFGSFEGNASALLEGKTDYWTSLDFPPYNSSGFSAVGSGMRNNWTFEGKKEVAMFWTKSEGEIASVKKKEIARSKLMDSNPYLACATIYSGNLWIDGSSAYTGMSVRCVKNKIPFVQTGSIAAGSATAVGCEGTIVSDGGAEILESGFCWSSSNAEPTLDDNLFTKGIKASGQYTCQITGLSTGVQYYVRAYAINEVGVAYGDVKTFTTIETETVTDIDGTVYPTVMIGEQVWMAEDLKVTKLNDGTPLSLITESSLWSGTTSPAYCMYENTAPQTHYGYLYNHLAVQTGKLAPAGWHVPTQTELEMLNAGLTADEDDFYLNSIKLKEAGSANWSEEYANGTNYSGFSALPGGMRFSDGSWGGKGVSGYWWTSSDYSYSANDAMSLFVEYYSAVVATDKKSGLSVRCLKDYPAVVTTLLKDLGQTTASFGIDVKEVGGDITRRGICWSSTQSQPDITGEHSQTYDFSVAFGESWYDITTLLPNTDYYLRAFAVNSTGVSYGPVVSFTTQNSETISDADGNVYHTIKIGTQTWMVENLKTTKYNDGSTIPVISGFHTTTPGYSIYANTSSNKTVYGLLYNWYAVQTGKLAPAGWRIPTDADWQVLIDYLGGSEVAGGRLKESGLSHWESPNEGAMDWGFKALPGGVRDGGSATFRLLKSRGFWWSVSPGALDYNAGSLYLVSWSGNVGLMQSYKSDALSVRCIKE